jgi:hypothetical protein
VRPRSWIGFFVVLGLLAVIGVALPILYNLNQQLDAGDLRRAEERWREAAPADYDLTFMIRYDREELAERHVVLVRGGKAVFAAVEDEVVHVAPALGALLGVAALGAERQRPRDVPAIFAHVESLLRDQESSGGNNFLVAVFDPKFGYPRRIVRRVRRSSTREEWELHLWAAGELEEKARQRGISGGQ